MEREGFHGKSRVETGGGNDYGGAVYGKGTYFHIGKEDSDEYLRGQHAYGWGDEVQIKASAHLDNPLKVDVPGEEGRDIPAFERKLREVGALKPGERYSTGAFHERGKSGFVSPDETTSRLQALGYDGIEITAAKYTPETEGSQLVVFDHTKASYGHQKPTLEEFRAAVSREGDWDGASTQDELTPAQSKAARATWNDLSKFVKEQGGLQADSQGGEVSFMFPNGARADGFYDKMVSRYLVAEIDGITVRVRRPARD